MKKLNIQLCAFALVLLAGWMGKDLAAQVTETVCAGNDFRIELNTAGTSTQWQKSLDGITFNDMAGETGSTLNVNPVTDDAWYRAINGLAAGCEVISDTIYVVQSQLTADAGVDDQVCSGSDVTLGGSPTATGAVGPVTYAWSDGATSSNPVINPTSNGTYSVTVTDSIGCTATSDVTIDITVVPLDSVEFTVGGTEIKWAFPECVDTVTVMLWGAQGNDGGNFDNVPTTGLGGNGGFAEGELLKDDQLANSDTLFIYVGLQNGWNGGSPGGVSTNNNGGNGGGASDIRYGGNGLSDRVVVAGGGGGGGGSSHGALSSLGAGQGGDGGGSAGTDCTGYPSNFEPTGGLAGTQASGGAGGNGGDATNLGCQDGSNGFMGQSLTGGPGGDGGFDSATCTSQGGGGGGGGGGFFGGGGGGGGQGSNSNISFPGAGGGGGDSFTGGIINGNTTQGVQVGDGKIMLIWGN